MTLLSLEGLTVRRGECPVVDDVTLSIGTGEVVGLIGPERRRQDDADARGTRAFLPSKGETSLMALPPARARAPGRVASAIPARIAWPVAVETLVMLGRVPHLSGGQRPGPADEAAVSAALAAMDLAAFAARPATELSGGEQARVPYPRGRWRRKTAPDPCRRAHGGPRPRAPRSQRWSGSRTWPATASRCWSLSMTSAWPPRHCSRPDPDGSRADRGRWRAGRGSVARKAG